ncbi:thioredoxin family protein [Chitinispirillales bacterium ANBcel5]|uniref:thioredoxin family protein n=1 Tax=Cellulosispirillum alkaliphilum TaxID=3039283 RepID=UPI002A536288|nr:thioredoxin family protein [Chitinispirillales bacterium ANBcel5]
MKRLVLFFFIALITLIAISCSGLQRRKSGVFHSISSVEHFEFVIQTSGSRLLAFDLHTEWCIPSRILAPTVYEIAKENIEQVSFYKVNTDRFPQIASYFETPGTPLIVFVKNGRIVYGIMGVQSKEKYERIINMYSDTADTDFYTPHNRSSNEMKIDYTKPSSPPL